jgi:hypothetical protein
MAKRYVELDGRRIVVGTIDEAAALCRTNDGRPFTPQNYRFRMRDSGTPPPLVQPDEDNPADLVPLRNARGKRLFPLYELPAGGELDVAPLPGAEKARAVTGYVVTVEEWERTRPRKGGTRLSQYTPATLPRTPGREGILVAARDGRLSVAPAARPDRSGPTLIDGVPQSRQVAQTRAVFERLGLLSPPAGEGAMSGAVSLTEEGTAVLTRWGVEPDPDDQPT